MPTRKCRCNRFGRGSYTTLHKEFGNCYGRWVRIGKGEDVTNIHTRRRLPSRHELCLYTMSRAHADKVRLSDMCGKIYAAQDLSVDKNRTITRLHYRLDWRNSYVFSYKKNKWGQAACATNSSYAKITCKAAMPGRRRRSNHYRLCDHSDVALQHVFGPDASIQLSITSPRAEYNIKKNICIHYILCVSIHAQAKHWSHAWCKRVFSQLLSCTEGFQSLKRSEPNMKEAGKGKKII